MKLPTDRILITGGAGFIGSALVHGLNQKGHTNIHVVDRLGTDEKWKNLTPLVFNDYLEADELMDYVESHPHSRPYSLILHLGACSSTMETDASYLIENNYRFTHRLAQYALHTRTRFVYASSAATYGDGTNGMDDTENAVQIFRPMNMYGYSKQMFDLHAQQNGWFKSITGLKYFNVFGPNENHKGEMCSLVNKAYHQIQETGRLKLFRSHHPDFEDGKQLRDFLYFKDAVDMTLHLARTQDATGLFNLGSGKAHTWLDLAHAIFKAMDKEPQIDFIDIPESIRDKYQYKTEADISKLRESGYEQPVTPLEEAVADYIQNYLAPNKYLGDG